MSSESFAIQPTSPIRVAASRNLGAECNATVINNTKVYHRGAFEIPRMQIGPED
jgi:hypothetical protein